MKKFFSVLFLITLFFIYLNGNEHFVIRIDNPTKNDVIYFNNLNYDIASYKPKKYLDLVVDFKTYKKLKKLGYHPYITQTEEQLKQHLSIKPLNGYKSYNEMLNELQNIVNNHPDICKLYDIGDSWGKIYFQEGYNEYNLFQHEIWLLKISDNVEINEDEPNIFFTGEHHAREPISMEMVLKIINYIVDNYGNDSQITEDVNTKQIWFIPLINPDGYKLVWDQTDVWWRKNIRDNNQNHHIYLNNSPDEEDGVDPNRNYGFHWGNIGASDNWTSLTYHGPHAFSEPEIQAVRDFICSYKFVAGISYHSYGELVLFPLGYDNNITSPDHDALQALAQSMANAIPSLDGNHYTPEESWQLYPCMGTSDDYFYGEHRIFAYTIELGTEFIPDPNTMNQILNDNIGGALVLLRRVDKSVLTGHVTDAETGEAISAQIYVNDIDFTGEEVSPYESDENFGRYYRFLLPGNYTVTFSKYGYNSQIHNISISPTQQTILDIQLQPITERYTLNGSIKDLNDFSAISGAKIHLENTSLDTVYSDSYGNFSIQNIVVGNYTLKIIKDGYITFFSNISINEDTDIPFFIEEINGESFEYGIPNNWNSHIIANQWHICYSVGYDGTHSLQSNPIGNNQNANFAYQVSNMETQSIVSFYHKVSSEANYDFLKFFIDDNLKGSWSGERDWEYSSYVVPTGTHNLVWVYSKDQGVSSGEDCAWIDMVLIPGSYPTTDFIIYPSEINLNILENTAFDTTFSIFNNTFGSMENISFSTNQNWLNFSEEFNSPIGLAAHNGKYVNIIISELPEGNYFGVVEITYNYNTFSLPITINVSSVSSNQNQIIPITKLENPSPNPLFTSIQKKYTKIKFQLAKKSKIELTIFNLKGQLISKLVNTELEAGNHTVLWNLKDLNGKNVSSGVYFYKLKTEDKVLIKKITIIN